jgi:hypothetical protein
MRKAPKWKSRKPRPGQKKRGRPANRRSLFVDAQCLRKKKPTPTWPEITRRLDPRGFAEDPGRAVERLRIGVQNLKKKGKRTSKGYPEYNVP